MRLCDFDFELPPDRIAQHPADARSASRLMVLERAGDAPARECAFGDLPRLLRRGDLLVVNRSRVVPARLELRRATGARVEVLFVSAGPQRSMSAWVKPMRRLRAGEVLCGEDELRLRFEGKYILCILVH